MDKLVFILFLSLTFYSCEDSRPKSLPENEKKDSSLSYDGYEIYLANLGVTVPIPAKYKFLDTAEIKNKIIAIEQMSLDSNLGQVVNSLDLFYKNPEFTSYFYDSTDHKNIMLFFGGAFENLNQDLLSRLDYTFNTYNRKLGVKSILVESLFLEINNRKFGKITRSNNFGNYTGYTYIYVLNGQNMTLSIICSSESALGFDEMVSKIKLDY